jgi:uncharacterized protein (TIGR02145 family)
MYTKFYQWNRATAWAAEGETVSGWTGGYEGSITDATWTNNPCPAGWRLPTIVEFQALDIASGGSYYNGSWSTEGGTWAAANERGNAVAGMFYGPRHATCSLPDNMRNCVFLPAVGYRGYSVGALYSQGSRGRYWSSTQTDDYRGYTGFNLYFYSTYSYPNDYNDKSYGFTLRCVQ